LIADQSFCILPHPLNTNDKLSGKEHRHSDQELTLILRYTQKWDVVYIALRRNVEESDIKKDKKLRLTKNRESVDKYVANPMNLRILKSHLSTDIRAPLVRVHVLMDLIEPICKTKYSVPNVGNLCNKQRTASDSG
jgi:hypothetical protein